METAEASRWQLQSFSAACREESKPARSREATVQAPGVVDDGCCGRLRCDATGRENKAVRLVVRRRGRGRAAWHVCFAPRGRHTRDVHGSSRACVAGRGVGACASAADGAATGFHPAALRPATSWLVQPQAKQRMAGLIRDASMLQFRSVMLPATDCMLLSSIEAASCAPELIAMLLLLLGVATHAMACALHRTISLFTSSGLDWRGWLPTLFRPRLLKQMAFVLLFALPKAVAR